MLGVLGLTPPEEATYRALVRRGDAQLAELAEAAGVPVSVVAAAVDRLVALGLATHPEPDRAVASSPELALDVLVSEREQELRRAGLAARMLAQEYRAERSDELELEVVEIVRGGTAIRERYQQLQRAARKEVLTFDRPPYVSPVGVNELELAYLARGVSNRSVYDAKALEVPGQHEWLGTAVAAGEQARVFPGLPIKLVVADRKAALVPLRMQERAVEMIGLLIGESALLDALIMLFESVWDRAVPVDGAIAGTAPPTGEIHGDDARLVALLASGLTDDGIARQLKISPRTVRRRVAAVMERLDARTRFQAGVQANRRSWC